MPAILVADDTIPVLDLLESLLIMARYSVFKASSGQEALDIFRREAIDVVITDVDMPGMGGIELLRKIREGHSFVPVVAISGYFEPQAAVEAGFDAFICKPFKIDAVLNVVADMLKKKRKVLIVDDVPEMREIVRVVVDQLGFHGIEAGNGAEALEILEKEGADLVISDCSMPIVSGRDFLAEVHARFPGLRVVVVSANFTAEDVKVLKPFDFLSKPYRIDDLKQVVLKAMTSNE